MAHLLGRLAGAAAHRWRRSLLIVLAVLVGLGALAAASGGTFTDDFSSPGTESQQAYDLLEERFPAQSGDTANLVFSVGEGDLRERDRDAAIDRTLAAVRAQPNVSAVAEPQLSPDGRTALAVVQYDAPAAQLGRDPGEALEEASGLAERAGVQADRNGAIVDQAEQASVPIGELIGVAVAIVVLTLVFRSAAAMALTLISALIALAGGLMLLTIGARFTDFPTFAPTLGVMLGLGAGIDYALLIVGRYREQLAAGDDVRRAATIANQTSGTSVVAAGVIVVVAIAGLLATGLPFVGRMGVGSAIVVAAVAVGAVTVLPVLMGAFARRLRPKDPAHVAPSARFARWGERLVAHPWRAAIAGTLVLLVLAAPFSALRLGQPDDGNDRASSTTRQAYDRLAEGFGAGVNGPLLLAASVPAGERGEAALGRVQQAVQRTEGVASVAPPQRNERGDAATLTVIPATSPQDERTSQLVQRLREDVLPGATAGTGAQVYVGGATATFEDLADKIASRLPLFIALVVGLSVLLLMAVFRSVWVPIVSAAFNLLSILAAYGVVVAVFQWGWGASLLGVDGEVPIVSFVPLFMFAVLFGLSMDYNVFLQSRIREEYFKGASARDSVVRGLARVARIILAAGAIMTAVFLGFVTDPEVVVKTIGLGLAVAILIDVTIVRLVVAPAVMALLGDRAWGLPGWLDRLLPKIALEGEEDGAPAGDERPATVPGRGSAPAGAGAR
jgi:RND superfamily putative drug exporter